MYVLVLLYPLLCMVLEERSVVYLHISHSHLVIVTYSLTLTGFSQCSTCCVFILDSDY